MTIHSHMKNGNESFYKELNLLIIKDVIEILGGTLKKLNVLGKLILIPILFILFFSMALITDIFRNFWFISENLFKFLFFN